MQKLQESVFSIVKTTSLSSAVFNFLQPTEDFADKTPLGGILRNTKYGWLALGPKFCVVDLRSGLKIAAHTFGNGISSHITVTSVVEIPTTLTDNSQQLVISLDCDDTTSLICVFHINGSQILRCIQTDVVITELAVCDELPNGALMCFDGLVMAGTRRGEVLVFDLNRAVLIQALRDISKGYEHLVRNENNVANLVVLPLKVNQVHKIENQRNLAVLNDNHLAILLNEDSFVDGQYIFRNPDGTIRMKAKQNHIRVTVVQYVPQLGSLAIGFNFGAFQIWNLLNLELEFTSQVNVECLPVTHFGFQEPCDDPRAFCYLWVVFSVTDRFEEEEFPLAVMYSLTYQGKRVLDDNKCLYQEFSSATIRFQIELNAMDDTVQFIGGRCVSCHTYSIRSVLGEEGEDTMLNLCQLIWECWGDNPNSGTQHGMLLFDLDQWYKDQMPATYTLESNAFMSTARCPEVSRGSCLTLDLRLDPASVAPYSHAMRLEEHFYPNSLQYNCIWLNTSEASILHTVGAQRQLVVSINAAGPSCLLSPSHLYAACRTAGLTPLYCDAIINSPEDQRRYLLSVALEARLARFLKRCAHDWATGTHSGVGCTLPFLIDWSWKRAIELKENAKELTAPLFTSATLPDRNVVRCLEHSVQQLTQLTGLLDAVLTKCCNLIVPDALSEMEEKYKGIGTVSLYFQVVQWFVRVGLLPERLHSYDALPYPAHQLYSTYNKRRVKLHRLQDKTDEDSANKSCPLLYIDQLIEHEFGGERVYQMWMKAGSECGGLYPPPSLYTLLRLYLIPDIAEEHKHSLLLYLLLDYSMLYDDMRYEAVIRRLMQFPTMFGLSNTAIKATQAFWHLDHRDFDFALDQLQCLTGNTLSDWQHHVVLSSLLAQKKTQAALQYLHVRKPPPIQKNNTEINDLDKLEDWQSCCNLYLARGLVYEALDVIRMCVLNAGTIGDKVHLLNFFYKGCRNTGQLSKVLQVTLLPFEEEVFINYLKNCDEPQTSDILIMYYLQQARYLEAQQYNDKIKSKNRIGDVTSTSTSTLLQSMDRASGVDALVSVVCSALPNITATVARCAMVEYEPHIIKSKPMSFYVQANSPKNTFTYKSSFIQDTIENASETWVNKPKLRKGIKRALNVEETPFICTPKLYKTRSMLSEQNDSEATPPKRLKLDMTGTPRTPKAPSTLRVSETLSRQMASFLDMPEVESPHKDYERAETPHSILKNRRLESRNQDAPSPVDSRYLEESDEEMETASNHTHYSDSNKHLRFTIPTSSEAGSTPSPVPLFEDVKEEAIENDDTMEDYGRRCSPLSNSRMESPPKKFAAEEMKSKKTYKDKVRARKSLSISINSSLSDDPNSSIESIADIPVTLINPRYSGEKHTRLSPTPPREDIEIKRDEDGQMEITKDQENSESFVPSTPQGRRSIRSISESIPSVNRSLTATPERLGSPIVTPLRSNRATRSRSRTPELSPRSSLAPIIEQPKQEVESEPHPVATTLSVSRILRSRSRTPEGTDKSSKEIPRLEAIEELPCMTESPQGSPTRRSLRSRSRTPERLDRGLKEIPSLEAIKEFPCTTESPPGSPSRRSLRSRSRTPELEVPEQSAITSPRSLRSRSKTPEKLMSPKKEPSRNKKSLSRIVLEANTFAKTKQTEKMDTETVEENTERDIECTPMKSSKDITRLMDVTFSPIDNKSILLSSSESLLVTENVSLPGFTTFHEICTEKSVLHSYQSSIGEGSIQETKEVEQSDICERSLPPVTTINENFGKSVLHSFESSIETSTQEEQKETQRLDNIDLPEVSFNLNENVLGKSVLSSANSSSAKDAKIDSSLMTSDSEVEIKDWKSQETAREMKEKKKIVEIVREINEIEGEMSDECPVESGSEDSEESSESIEEESSEEAEEEEEDSGQESDSENEVISIDDSSDADNLQIDEQVPIPESAAPETVETITIQEVEDIQVEQEIIKENPIEIIEKQDNNKLTSKEEEENNETIPSTVEDSTDPFNQARNLSILTDDNSIIEAESISLHYSVDNKDKEDEVMEKDESAEKIIPVETLKPINVPDEDIEMTEHIANKENVDGLRGIDVVDAGHSMEVQVPEVLNISKDEHEKEIVETTQKKENLQEKVQQTDEVNKDNEIINEEMQTEQIKVIPKNVEFIKEDVENINDPMQNEEAGEKEKSGPSRKRTKSISSTKSTDDEPKTPSTRKRTQSNASNKSETDHKTPKNKSRETTPSRKVKTPLSETRTIITRRISKEIYENVEESLEDVSTPKRRSPRTRSKKEDDNKSVTEDISTPKRRSSRTKSKQEDDNISVASDSSVSTIRLPRSSQEVSEEQLGETSTPRRRSARSQSKKGDDNVSGVSDSSIKSGMSKMGEDNDPKIRKGRKSILSTKTDLSVIPEVAAEESKESEDVYALSGRRLTRNQKAVLESWLEPKPGKSPLISRRTSVASDRRSELDDDDDASSVHSLDSQTAERINLLNKMNFEGSPDPDELAHYGSTLAGRRSRMTRAASETKALPKPARVVRSVSVDIGTTPDIHSPASASGTDTPTRGRRASFARACEALQTPKGRRASVDQKKLDSASQQGSPASASEAEVPVTPSRRPRRASTASNASQTKTDSARKPRKTATDKNKETKE